MMLEDIAIALKFGGGIGSSHTTGGCATLVLNRF
jgi:hypothetical protein